MLTNKQHAEAVLERCAMIDSIRKTFIDIGHRRTDGLVQLFNEVKVLLPERDAEEVPNSIYARPPIVRLLCYSLPSKLAKQAHVLRNDARHWGHSSVAYT